MNQLTLKLFGIVHYGAQSHAANLVSVTRVHVFVEVTSLEIHTFSTLDCEYFQNEFKNDMKMCLLVCYLFKQTVYLSIVL